ncbi:MAG: hypothetical protein LAO78_12875 [Acidobacteriia bacterium]|nr:hypothetical protein [Terriglobia bacterium]
MAEHVQDLDLEDPDDQEDPNQEDEQPLVLTRDDMDALRFKMEQEIRKELGAPPKWDLPKFKIEFHRRQLALLEQANHAPRCEHVFTDGRSCGAPRVRKGKLCYAHTLMEEKRPRRWNLPPLEDANAVMLWLMDVLRGLAEGRISEKTAGLMFYGLQLAMVNARFTTFRDTNHAEMVTKAPRDRRNRASSPTSEAKALPQRSAEEEPSGDFTAENAEIADEESQEKGTASRTEDRLEPQNAEGIPGVESAKSIFFGVEPGEGVADNRSVSLPSEAPRKSSQSEVLIVPEDVEHHAGR